jgi:hypothetical protein
MAHVHTMTGPAMQKILTILGIPARQVTRQRKTGEYIADFFVPPALGEPINNKHTILPAQTYADMLCEKMPGAQITSLGEWTTDWRDNPADHVRYEAYVAFIVPETFTINNQSKKLA